MATSGGQSAPGATNRSPKRTFRLIWHGPGRALLARNSRRVIQKRTRRDQRPQSSTHSREPVKNCNIECKCQGTQRKSFRVETVIGGKRHGLSFLLRVPAVEGSPLPFARLVEARYFHSASQDRLAFSLGFPEEKPSTYETAFGRVLTPYLEKRCLSCHVAPRTRGALVESGVSCENCHGPGQPHLAALSKHSQDLGILNPKQAARCRADAAMLAMSCGLQSRRRPPARRLADFRSSDGIETIASAGVKPRVGSHAQTVTTRIRMRPGLYWSPEPKKRVWDVIARQ